uniref:Uncharacterized protein n=1 Tax=Chenopodium quinoa TaxID=63459 RepID=A0A803MHY6_CHEQI
MIWFSKQQALSTSTKLAKFRLRQGFTVSDFAELIRVNPSIYFMGLYSNIVPAIQALRVIMGCEHLVIRILAKSRRLRLSEKTIESKRKVFRSFGWTESDIATLSSSFPPVFGLTEATIKKKLDFFMNKLGYKPSFLSKRYNLLTYSLEKRILPRHKTLIVLKEKGFIKMDYLLESSVSMTESRFLKKFVLPFKEVHGVYSQHAGISLELLTLGSSETNSKAA